MDISLVITTDFLLSVLRMMHHFLAAELVGNGKVDMHTAKEKYPWSFLTGYFILFCLQILSMLQPFSGRPANQTTLVTTDLLELQIE